MTFVWGILAGAAIFGSGMFFGAVLVQMGHETERKKAEDIYIGS